MIENNYFQDDWHEEFQKDGKNGVHGFQDKQIIQTLMKELDISHEYLGQFNSDSHYYSKKRDDQKLPYKRIRDTADLLGIPPWLIFADHDGNEELIERIEAVEDPLPVYYVNWDELFMERSMYSNPDEECAALDPLKLVYRFTEVLGVLTQGLLRDEFKFAAHLGFLMQQVEAARMTIRIVKKTRNDLPPTQRKSITACWSIITPSEFSERNNREKTMINMIVTLLNRVFKNNGKSEYIFEDTFLRLVSWHSHRKLPTNQFMLSILGQRENQYLSHSVNKLHCVQFINPYSKINQQDLLQEKELDEKDKVFWKYNEIYEGPKNKHLRYLMECGRIVDGTTLIATLVDNKTYKDVIDVVDERVTAKVVIYGSKVLLRWEHDKKVYTVTELNQNIIDLFGLELSAKRGVGFWRFEDGYGSLKKVVQLLKDREGQMSFL